MIKNILKIISLITLMQLFVFTSFADVTDPNEQTYTQGNKTEGTAVGPGLLNDCPTCRAKMNQSAMTANTNCGQGKNISCHQGDTDKGARDENSSSK